MMTEADKNQELIDILDKNGIKTGQIATREEAHRNALWHRIAAVTCVDSKNRVLIQQRSMLKAKNPGKWDIFSAAGHLTTGQDSLSAAAREISEEIAVSLGLDASIKDFRFMTSFRKLDDVNDNWHDRQYYDYFIYRIDKIDVDEIKFQESEVQALRLVEPNELMRMLETGSMVQSMKEGNILLDYLFKF